MRTLSLILITLTFAACGTPVDVSPIQEPQVKMESDCTHNELPENCEEEETHNEL